MSQLFDFKLGEKWDQLMSRLRPVSVGVYGELASSPTSVSAVTPTEEVNERDSQGHGLFFFPPPNSRGHIIPMILGPSPAASTTNTLATAADAGGGESLFQGAAGRERNDSVLSSHSIESHFDPAMASAAALSDGGHAHLNGQHSSGGIAESRLTRILGRKMWDSASGTDMGEAGTTGGTGVPAAATTTTTIVVRPGETAHWMDDKSCLHCYDCHEPFTTFRRRHHCRICGLIFCSKCSSNYLQGEIIGRQGSLRSCNYCYKSIMEEERELLEDESSEETTRRKLLSARSSILSLSYNLSGYWKHHDRPQKMTAPPFSAPFRREGTEEDYEGGPFSDGYIPYNNTVQEGGSETLIQSLEASLVQCVRSAEELLLTQRVKPSQASFQRYQAKEFIEGYSLTGDHAEREQLLLGHRDMGETLASSRLDSFVLDSPGQRHLRLLLRQLMGAISLSEKWEDVILFMARRVCGTMNPNVRGGDEIDIRRYVKIKKILGGSYEDSVYLAGVAATKNVAHKKMAHSFRNPRVLIIKFALEYERAGNQFLSLEPVLSEEKKYLKAVIGKIAALQPHIVLVEKTVSQVAQELLLESDITLVKKVKPSVIEAVSRSTNAAVLTSIDQLNQQPTLGTCERFQVISYSEPGESNRKKTVMVFEGGDMQRECTLIIRGPDYQELCHVKRTLNFFIFASYSLKLEEYVLRDEFSRQGHDPSPENFDNVPDSVARNIRALVDLYRSTLVSISPGVRFPLPFQLQSALGMVKIRPGQPPLLPMEDESKEVARLDPYKHQNLVVLFTIFCDDSLSPCKFPQSLTIDYYQENDITLGQFIEELSFNLRFACPSCDKDMLVHRRSYVHGDARIFVSMEELPSPVPGAQSTILMWNMCKKCLQVTPIVPMSEETWKYSTGKFLEISFHNAEPYCRSEVCSHKLHRDHIRCFGFQGHVIKMEYEKVSLLEIMVPQMKIQWNEENLKGKRDLAVQELVTSVNNFYDSIFLWIKGFDFSQVLPEKQDACKIRLLGATKKLSAEKTALFSQLEAIMQESLPTDTLCINTVLKGLHQLALNWRWFHKQIIRVYTSANEKPGPATPGTPLPVQRLPRSVASGPSPSAQRSIHRPRRSPKDTLAEISGSIDRESTASPPALLPDDQPLTSSQPPQEPNVTHPGLHLPHDDKALGNEIEKAQEGATSSLATSPFPSDTPDASIFETIPSLVAAEVEDAQNGPSSARSTSPLPSKDGPPGGTPQDRPTLPVTPASSTLTPLRPTSIRWESAELNLINSFLSTTLNANSPSVSPPPLVLLASMPGSRRGLRGIPRSPSAFSGQSRPDSVTDLTQPATEKKGHRRDMSSSSFRGHSRDSSSGVEEDGADEGNLPEKPIDTIFEQPPDDPWWKEVADETPHEGLSPARQLDLEDEDSEFETHLEGVDGLGPLEPVDGDEEALQQQDQLGSREDAQQPQGATFIVSMDSTDAEGQALPNKAAVLGRDDSKAQGKGKEGGGEVAVKEKSNFIQTIQHFLQNLSTTEEEFGYPIPPGYHIFPDSLLIVMESEPSSIVSFCLSSKEYARNLEETRRLKTKLDAEADLGGRPTPQPVEGASDLLAQDSKGRSSSTAHVKQVKWTEEVEVQQSHPLQQTSVASPEADPQDPRIPEDPRPLPEEQQKDFDFEELEIEDTLNQKEGSHIKYQFSEGSTNFYCKVFFVEQFEALRKNCGVDGYYIQSMARCVKWKAKGGKSGSAFSKTVDGRFVIKQLSRSEMVSFLKFAPAYFEYMSRVIFKKNHTALAKIFGVYQIQHKNSETGKSFKQDVLVMEDLFYNRNIKRIFDLKGSIRSRYAKNTGQKDDVLLDENLIEAIYSSPLYVREHSKRYLLDCVTNDSQFLSDLNVIDYSLLVGIDEENQELVVGIVDYIRTYTWDKKLESWVKETGLLGGGGKEPTILSPKLYQKRFIEAMKKYFLLVAEKWSDPFPFR